MKTQNTLHFASISQTNLAALTQQVAETFATETTLPTQKITFCAADLWNIQRTRKVRTFRKALA